MTGATLNSKTPNGPGSEGKLLSDLQAKYPEADNRLRDFNASLANLAPTNIIKLGVASTLALQASVGEKDIVFRFIRDVHQIDAAAIIRSHLAVFRILNLVGAGHLILPAALTETPTEIKVHTEGAWVSNPNKVMVTEYVPRGLRLFRDKNRSGVPLAGPQWAELISNEDKMMAALAGYLTVQQDMLWTNIFASNHGEIIVFDFDNCWRRPFPFTPTKPIFFPGGPLGYKKTLQRDEFPSRANELVNVLSRTASVELAESWQLTLGEAEITIEKAQRVVLSGLSEAISQDPEYKDLYWDAPPWWGSLECSQRKKLEQRTGWKYNDYYDSLG